MYRPMHSVPEAGKALRKRDRLPVGDVAPETEKNRRRPTSCTHTPGPGPVATVDGAWHPPRSGRAPARRDAPAPGPAWPARGGGFRGSSAPGFRLQVHTGPGRPAPAGAPSRGPAPPPAYSSPFMRTPSAAATAASAAAVAVASRRIGWRPRRRHFPTARGACGSAAALQARPLARGQANRGVRGGAGRGRPRTGVPPGLPGPCPPFPLAAAGRAPEEPTQRRQAGAGTGATAGCALARGPVLAPPPGSCQSAERGAGLAEGRPLPRSRRPAPAPAPSPAPCTPRPPQGPGLGRSVGKGWWSFNRRQSGSDQCARSPSSGRGASPVPLTPPCPPRRRPGAPRSQHEASAPRVQLLRQRAGRDGRGGEGERGRERVSRRRRSAARAGGERGPAAVTAGEGRRPGALPALRPSLGAGPAGAVGPKLPEQSERGESAGATLRTADPLLTATPVCFSQSSRNLSSALGCLSPATSSQILARKRRRGVSLFYSAL